MLMHTRGAHVADILKGGNPTDTLKVGERDSRVLKLSALGMAKPPGLQVCH